MKIFAVFLLAMAVYVANVEAAAQPYVVPIYRVTVDGTTGTTDGTTDGTSTDGTTTAPTSTTTVSVETSPTTTQKPTIPAVFEEKFANAGLNKIRHPRSLLLVNPQGIEGRKFEHVCSGTLIHESAIITTATCIELATDGTGVNAYVGTAQDASSADSATKTLYEVNKVIKHPAFNAETNENNLAVLKLTSKVDFSLSTNVKSISWTSSIPAAETACMTSYWNAADPYTQENQEVTVKACNPLKDGSICSTFTPSPAECPSGANGASLVCADKLAGVFSAHRNADCSAALWQYEEISKDATWIDESVNSATILNVSFAAILALVSVVMKGL